MLLGLSSYHLSTSSSLLLWSLSSSFLCHLPMTTVLPSSIPFQQSVPSLLLHLNLPFLSHSWDLPCQHPSAPAVLKSWCGGLFASVLVTVSLSLPSLPRPLPLMLVVSSRGRSGVLGGYGHIVRRGDIWLCAREWMQTQRACWKRRGPTESPRGAEVTCRQ